MKEEEFLRALLDIQLLEIPWRISLLICLFYISVKLSFMAYLSSLNCMKNSNTSIYSLYLFRAYKRILSESVLFRQHSLLFFGKRFNMLSLITLHKDSLVLTVLSSTSIELLS